TTSSLSTSKSPPPTAASAGPEWIWLSSFPPEASTLRRRSDRAPSLLRWIARRHPTWYWRTHSLPSTCLPGFLSVPVSDSADERLPRFRQPPSGSPPVPPRPRANARPPHFPALPGSLPGIRIPPRHQPPHKQDG